MATTDITYHGDLAAKLVQADQITPYPSNPKQGNVTAVAESISTNGVYRPIYVQTSTGYIIAGHHVFYALTIELGQTTVPVVYLDVDDERARRIRLADNKIPELGGYDDRLLAEELAALETLDGTGYDVGDLEALEKLLEREHDAGSSDDVDEGVLDDTDEAGWPLIRCRVSPELHQRWVLIEADNDAQRVGLLLDAAGF